MKSVAEILREKADHHVYTIAPTATVFEAVSLMATKNVGALLVMEEGRIVGIVSERDYARKMLSLKHSPREVSVREVMTTAVMYVGPQHTNEECMALMTDNRLRHLPVLEDGRLIGLISIGDLVKDIISEQKFIIEQLEHYITGQPL